MEPWIVFSRGEFVRLAKEHGSFEDLYNYLEDKRKRVKEALDYSWDNRHFYMTDSYGNPVLQVGPFKDDVSFWNAQNGRSIKTITDYGELMSGVFVEWLDNIQKGLTRCCVCGQWREDYKSFSFAGAVCSDCYDPDVHIPPDSR